MPRIPHPTDSNLVCDNPAPAQHWYPIACGVGGMQPVGVSQSASLWCGQLANQSSPQPVDRQGALWTICTGELVLTPIFPNVQGVWFQCCSFIGLSSQSPQALMISTVPLGCMRPPDHNNEENKSYDIYNLLPFWLKHSLPCLLHDRVDEHGTGIANGVNAGTSVAGAAGFISQR